MMYISDHKDYFFPIWIKPKAGSYDGQTWQYFFHKNYVSGKMIFNCPRFEINANTPLAESDNNTYGINYLVIAGSYWWELNQLPFPNDKEWDRTPAKLNQVKAPSRTVLMIDVYNQTDPKRGNSSCYSYDRVKQGKDGVVAYAPHSNHTNLTWCDGSSLSLKVSYPFGCYEVLGELNGKGKATWGAGNYWDRTNVRKGGL